MKIVLGRGRVFIFLALLLVARPVLAISFLPGVQVGATSSATLSEASGIVGSRSLAGVLWTHNDSGDSARFFALGTDGTLLGQFSLTGGFNVDWEDIALGPKPGGGNYLYLADIGDNNLVHSEVTIYRTTEPATSAGGSISAANYTYARMQYPGGPRNAESMMVDPISGDVYVVTKNPSGQVFRAPSTVFNNTAVVNTFSLQGTLSVPLSQPSAADISPDGKYILIRDRSTTAYVFERGTGQSVWDAIQGAGSPVTLRSETQGEAIGWAADGKGFYTTSEWAGQGAQPIYFYAVVPEPAARGILATGLLTLAGMAWAKRRNQQQRGRHREPARDNARGLSTLCEQKSSPT